MRRNGSLIAPAVLGVLGASGIAFGIASVIKYHPLPILAVVLLVVSLAVAAVFGVARARTVRVWRGPQNEVLRKGTATTTGLWLASVCVHIGLGLWIDHAAGGRIAGDRVAVRVCGDRSGDAKPPGARASRRAATRF